MLDLVDIGVLFSCLLGTFFLVKKMFLKPAPPPAPPLYISKFGVKTPGGAASKDSSRSYDDRNINDSLDQLKKKTVMFYGSQTGTAESYAKKLAKEASSRFGLEAMMADVDDYDFESLDCVTSEKVVCFVMATFGEGEPTDNATPFWEFLMGDSTQFSKGEDLGEQPLRNLNYAVFGLGNSSYEHFNKIAKDLNQRLESLGAHRIGPYGQGDEATQSTENDYLSWKDELFAAWKKERNLDERPVVYEPGLELNELDLATVDMAKVHTGEVCKDYLLPNIQGPYTLAKPFLAPVTVAREIFNSPDRNAIHLDIDITGSGMRYTTGDHIGISTQNRSDEVARFLRVFGISNGNAVFDIKKLDQTAKVPFPTPSTYDAVVRQFLDICGPVSRQFMTSIAPFAPNETARQESVQLGADRNLFAETVTKRHFTVARLLEKLSNGEPWTKVPFTFLVESMPFLSPRYYSISSSSSESPNVVSVSAVVEAFPTSEPGVEFRGLATNYFLDLKKTYDGSLDASNAQYIIRGPRDKYACASGTAQLKLPVHIRKSNFRMPKNHNVPVIMVGPGTGVAPFRGFIHERAHKAGQQPVGKALLFFGSRNSVEDFLYADEWENYQSDKRDEKAFQASEFLQVVTAFSRETEQKVYVQHRLEQEAQYVNELLEQGAYFYVCGDASRMAKDVQSALIRIISQQRSIEAKEAESLVKRMRLQGKYQEDVW